MDYFAVSLPDLQIWDGDLNKSNRVYCLFMLALGYYGLGDINHALRYINETSAIDPNHIAIYQFRTLMNL